MPVVIPTRDQLAYNGGDPRPLRLIADKAVEVGDDLCAALLAGGDARLAASDPDAEGGAVHPARRRR